MAEHTPGGTFDIISKVAEVVAEYNLVVGGGGTHRDLLIHIYDPKKNHLSRTALAMKATDSISSEALEAGVVAELVAVAEALASWWVELTAGDNYYGNYSGNCPLCDEAPTDDHVSDCPVPLAQAALSKVKDQE